MGYRFWSGEEGVTAGDWNDNDNWDGGNVPTTGDIAIFDGRTAQDVTSNLNAGTNLGGLIEMPGNTCQIGTETNPLCIQCSGLVSLRGSASVYLMSGNGASDVEIDTVIIEKATSLTVNLASEKNAAAGNVSKFGLVHIIEGLVVVRGDSGATATPTMDAGTFIEQLLLTPRRDSDNLIDVRVGDGCSDIQNTVSTKLIMTGGTLVSYTDFDIREVLGGKLSVA